MSDTSSSDSRTSNAELMREDERINETNINDINASTEPTQHNQNQCCKSKRQRLRDGWNRVRRSIASLAKPGLRRDMLSWSSVVIIGTSAVISLLYTIIFIAVPHSSYSATTHNFISNNPILTDGQPIDGLSRWLEDFSRSVIPIMCHSHNDYWRPYPLFSALATGCTGVEADVWLQDDGETLLVGHDRGSLRPEMTLEKMYLDPLFEILEHRNPGEVWENNTVYDRARGVFQTQPNMTLVLMIDVKTEPSATWKAVLKKLERFRHPTKRYLTRYENVFPAPGFVERQEIWPSALTVVGSGNMEGDTIVNLYTEIVPIDPVTGEGGHSYYYRYHDTFLDAPLGQLPDDNTFWRAPDGQSGGSSKMWYPGNSYYASVSFQQSIGNVRTGFSEKQRAKLRSQIRTAKKSGLLARYWDLPSWPISYRDYVWQTLTEEGVGMLSVDDLESAARRGWTKGYIRDVVWMICLSVYIFLCSLAALWFGYRTIRRWRNQPRQDIYLE
ncbi:uncharacterized protein BDR25DRAFT_275056 [Lindgomyces ingoldianus]|uniref:Uncharacterized protein n=1 Tax=Lindgomyces ingoldianus TaxID=673940 RepID=A0ACB6RH89_9PLEO|nr:uncharacterized protein BDR25DRAFT_275056 [Lindgomyces ingoldianus]KAF2477710.1 hypothetical protein BDR25DRAFT_275056 [Lindgomyces ingoldianus]